MLAFDTAGVRALLGEVRAVADEHPIGFGPGLDDVLTQSVEQRAVLPGGDTDEVLQAFARDAEEVGDGFAGLARQGGQFALEDQLGVAALLLALEERQVTAEEWLNTLGQLLQNLRGDDSVVKEGLSFRVFQYGHRLLSC